MAREHDVASLMSRTSFVGLVRDYIGIVIVVIYMLLFGTIRTHFWVIRFVAELSRCIH